MKKTFAFIFAIAILSISGCTQAIEKGQEIQNAAQTIRSETDAAVKSAQESVADAADQAWATKEKIEDKAEAAQDALDAIDRLTED